MLLMDQAFETSSHKMDPLETERLSVIIYQVMSARYRIFHTMEHIFTAAEDSSGVNMLAAFCHDLVYYQVDKRIHPLILPHLTEFNINEKTNECILPELSVEHWMSISGKIFGFNAHQTLNPFNGLNEFLSAVATARMLSPFLGEWQVIQIIACMEATIPFRSQLNPETNSFKLLRERLSGLNQEYQLKKNDNEIDEVMSASIKISNQDVCSFYAKDFGEFISGTWNLILENNPIFKNPLYTVIEYRKALQKVRGFFSFLNYENVVHEWGNFPPRQDFLEMKQQVSINLKNAIQYIDLKLVGITILEVFAMSTGGDAPYFLLIGKSPDGSSKAPIERFFPDTKVKKSSSMDAVYEVLKNGRKAKSSFDFNHSPVSSYLFENLSSEEIQSSILLTQEFHEGKIDAQKFIHSFRPEILEPISKGVSEVSWSRKPKI